MGTSNAVCPPVNSVRFQASALLGAWAIFAIFALFSVGKPLTLDQAWPVALQAGSIAEGGFKELGSKQYEIAHPPLFKHLLGLAFRIFGESSTVARAFGMATFAATSLVLMLLAEFAFPEQRERRVGAIAVLIYAASPFAIQHSLVVDSTTTLLPLFGCILLLALYVYDFRVTRRSALPLGASLALCVWSHESLAMLPVAAVALYLCWTRGFRFALRTTLAILAVGLGLFTISWLAYTSITGVSPLSFVRFSILGKLLQPGFAAAGSFDLYQERVWVNLTWLSIPMLCLLAFVAARRLRELSHGTGGRPSDLLWIHVGIVLLVTNTIWTQLSRYMAPAYPVLCLLIAGGLASSLGGLGVGRLAASAVLGALLGIALPDPLVLSKKLYLAVAVIAPMLAAWGLTGIGRAPESKWTRLSGVLLLGSLTLAVWTNVKQTASKTTSVSWSEYGELGFESTQRYLEQTGGTSTPVLRKDLAYALLRDRPGRSFEWIYNRPFRKLWEEGGRQRVRTLLARPDVEVVVLDPYTDSPLARELLAVHFDEAQRHGDFTVFRRRAQPSLP